MLLIIWKVHNSFALIINRNTVIFLTDLYMVFDGQLLLLPAVFHFIYLYCVISGYLYEWLIRGAWAAWQPVQLNNYYQTGKNCFYCIQYFEVKIFLHFEVITGREQTHVFFSIYEQLFALFQNHKLYTYFKLPVHSVSILHMITVRAKYILSIKRWHMRCSHSNNRH